MEPKTIGERLVELNEEPLSEERLEETERLLEAAFPGLLDKIVKSWEEILATRH